MSMILGLMTLADSTIDQVLKTPVLIWRIVAPGEYNTVQEAVSAKSKHGLLARLFCRNKGARPVNPVLPDLILADGERTETDLDKAWHGIHYLLTGSDWSGDPPLNFLVAGGTPVGDIDVGYGPARVFRAADVVRIRDALIAIPADYLRQRYDPDAMIEKDIYPTIWDRNAKDDDALGYLLEYFAALRQFINDAAKKGLGIVVTIT